MTDRDGQDRGGPGEMAPGGIGPVIGDIERETTASTGASGPARAGAFAPTLEGLAYPLARDDLVREAAVHGAAGGLLDRLSRVPDRVYVSAEDVAGELERMERVHHRGEARLPV